MNMTIQEVIQVRHSVRQYKDIAIDAETAAQVYSEWIPRTEQIDVSVHAPRK